MSHTLETRAAVCELGGGWQPESSNLQSLISLLLASQNPAIENSSRSEIASKVNQLAYNPEFFRYLAFLFSEGNSVQCPLELRRVAGLTLLRAIRIGHSNDVLTSAGLEHVKRSLISVINSDVEWNLRKTACSAIASVALIGNLLSWSELFETLVLGLEQTADVARFEICLLTLEYLCEDCGEQLSTRESGTPKIALFLPLLFKCFLHPSAKTRARSVRCVNCILSLENVPVALLAQSEELLLGLSALASDNDPVVRKEVCEALSWLLSLRPEVMLPHIQSVVSFIIESIGNEDEDVAKAAVEFILEFIRVFSEHNGGEKTMAEEVLTSQPQQFRNLLAILLKRMEYTEEDLMMLCADDEKEENQPDRAQNISPSFHGTSTRGFSGGDPDSEDENDEDSEDYANAWTVRKAAGQVLDSISRICAAESVLPSLLPILQDQLNENRPWKTREAAVLALGAIAKGYSVALSDHLENLVKYLICEIERGDEIELRNISLWTISRYSVWLKDFRKGSNERENLISQIVSVMAKAATQTNKRIQQRACSSLAVLVEDLEGALDPYCKNMCDVFVEAFKRYETNSRKSMLDLFCALLGSCPAMLEPPTLNKVLAVVWEEYDKVHEADQLILDYFAFFGVVAEKAGTQMRVVSKPLCDRALRYIEDTLVQNSVWKEMDIHPDDFDYEHMLSSMELLSSLAIGQGPHLCEFVDTIALQKLLSSLLKENQTVVMEVLFALIGDISSALTNVLVPILPDILHALCDALCETQDEDNSSMISNAVWASGRLALQMRDTVGRIEGGTALISKVAEVMKDQAGDNRIQHNAAVALGRFAIHNTDFVASGLAQVGSSWAINFRQINNIGDFDVEEKRDCLAGLLAAVGRNPGGICDGVNHFFLAMLSVLRKGTPEMKIALGQVLNAMKTCFQDQHIWSAKVESINPSIFREFQKAYPLLA